MEFQNQPTPGIVHLRGRAMAGARESGRPALPVGSTLRTLNFLPTVPRLVHQFRPTLRIMDSATEEILSVLEELPPERREEVTDFAKFLLARQADDRWEQLITNPDTRPKLEAFMESSTAGGSEPLDFDRL